MPQVVATESFHFAPKGQPMVSIVKGTVMDSKEAVVKANPGRFMDADQWLEKAAAPSPVFHFPAPIVEAATAAPGETRTVKKPAAKKAAAKK